MSKEVSKENAQEVMREGEGQRRYGLFTAITMIVGIVIGSGIFFKTDDILGHTGGSIWLGILVFTIAAISIIFGSLSISNLAMFTDRTGGAMTYAEEFISKRFGSAFGWFQTLVYLPTLTVVISWVFGIYFCQLFDIDGGLGLQVLIGIIWSIICFGYNIVAPKLGGFFQNASTVIKIIPLAVIAIAGMIFGNPSGALADTGTAVSSAGWVAAIGPIAFSFDGWIISTTISHEVKDAKKNMPKALVIAPIFVLICYLVYFVGVSAYLGPDKVMKLGDASAAEMARQIFKSDFAAKALITFVTISIMGTVNGIIIGIVRMPYALATRHMLPGSSWIGKMNEKYQMPVNSGFFAMGICAIWWAIHYFTMKYKLLANADISEISIVMCYVLFIMLYYKVFAFWREGKIKGIARGVVFPLLATIGAGFIIYGGLQNPYFFIFVAVSLLVVAVGYFYKPSGAGEIVA